MKSKLFIPVVLGLALVAGVAIYKISGTHRMSTDTAQAATMPAGEVASAMADDQTQARPAPDFALKDVNGKTVRLSDYKGKIVVLNFWATWCPPCRKEIPDFIELQKEYGQQGVQFIGIALDDEGLAKVKPWLEKNPVTYPIVLPDNKVVSSYGEMTSIPVTYVIDREGTIRDTYTGMRPKGYLDAQLKSMIAKK